MAKTIKITFLAAIIVSIVMNIFKMGLLEIAAFGVVVATYFAFVFVWESIEKRIKAYRRRKNA